MCIKHEAAFRLFTKLGSKDSGGTHDTIVMCVCFTTFPPRVPAAADGLGRAAAVTAVAHSRLVLEPTVAAAIAEVAAAAVAAEGQAGPRCRQAHKRAAWRGEVRAASYEASLSLRSCSELAVRPSRLTATPTPLQGCWQHRRNSVTHSLNILIQ